jgi:hypothetical protein
MAGGFLTALALYSPEPEPERIAYSTPQDLTPPEPIREETAETGSAARAEGFLVGELDGYIAVWHNTDRAMPIEATGIAVRSLRVMDQEMLRAGVIFEDYMDVIMFLEDFCP